MISNISTHRNPINCYPSTEKEILKIFWSPLATQPRIKAFQNDNSQRVLNKAELFALGYIRYLGNKKRGIDFLVAEKAQQALLHLIEEKEDQVERTDQSRATIIHDLKTYYTSPRLSQNRMGRANP